MAKFLTSKVVISIDQQIYSYREFYLFLKKILLERGYDIEEKTYTAKSSDTVDFYWNTIKTVDDFTKYQIEINVRMNMEEVNVIRDKKKETVNKGSGSIKLKSTLITDYAGKWEESIPWISFVKVMFENIFQKGSVDEYTRKLTDEAYEIENEVKSFFNLQKMM